MDIHECALTNLYNLMRLRIVEMRFANLLFSERYFFQKFQIVNKISRPLDNRHGFLWTLIKLFYYF